MWIDFKVEEQMNKKRKSSIMYNNIAIQMRESLRGGGYESKSNILNKIVNIIFVLNMDVVMF